MNFNITERNDIVIITPDGPMMGGPDATRLKENLHDLISRGKNKIVIDMLKVDRMNSSGLGILIGGLTTIRNNKGDLKLLHLGEKLGQLLRITKLDQVFEFFEDEDKVIESFT